LSMRRSGFPGKFVCMIVVGFYMRII